jgi:GntR family transcriptional regulator
MEIRGVVETQQGTGTFVASRQADTRKPAERRKVLAQLVDRYAAIALSKGFTVEELIEAMSQRVDSKGRRTS